MSTPLPSLNLSCIYLHRSTSILTLGPGSYLERDVSLGADGSWLDNMGANLYGAKSPRGGLLNR